MARPPNRTPQPSEDDFPAAREGRPGVGVDARGAAVIDPTKNVLDLVRAESKYQDGMRDAAKEAQEVRERLHLMRMEAESRIQNWMRDSEMKRISELATLRQAYDSRIADMLRTSVESTSSLVSTQLVQIQNTFNDRVAKLEQFRWESGGKTSVSDPAIADALAKLATSSTGMKDAMTESFNTLAIAISAMRSADTSRREGITERRLDAGHLIAWGVAIMMGLGMVLTYGHFVH